MTALVGDQFKFKKLSLLSSGAYGTVHLCKPEPAIKAEARSEPPADTCVVKTVQLAKLGPQERFCSIQEMCLMTQLQHRNLVQALDAWLDNSCTTARLAMTHCARGDLTGLLAERRSDPLQEHDVCILFVQVRSKAADNLCCWPGNEHCCHVADRLCRHCRHQQIYVRETLSFC